jgi:hypothetical protein
MSMQLSTVQLIVTRDPLAPKPQHGAPKRRLGTGEGRRMFMMFMQFARSTLEYP